MRKGEPFLIARNSAFQHAAFGGLSALQLFVFADLLTSEARKG